MPETGTQPGVREVLVVAAAAVTVVLGAAVLTALLPAGAQSIVFGTPLLIALHANFPFTQRFADLTPLQRDTYFATFACTALSSILLIAPSAQHRILFRQFEKEKLIRRSNALWARTL